jgi:hypothetical protein
MISATALLLASLPAFASSFVTSPSTLDLTTARSGEVTVTNNGERSTVFRVSPTYFRMVENGDLAEGSSDGASNDLAPHVRYSPRQFELRPGETQLVRIALRQPAGLAPGEYRVHLKIEADDPVGATAGEEKGATQFTAKVRIARAIRVVYRNAVPKGRAALESISVSAADKPGHIRLAAQLARDLDGGTAEGRYRVEVRRPNAAAEPLWSSTDLPARVYADLDRRTLENELKLQRDWPADALYCVVYVNDVDGTDARQQQCAGR